MSVVIENLENLKRKIVLTLESSEIESDKLKRLQMIARRAKIDGYRPGKIPLKVVERNFGQQTKEEVIEDLIRKQYNKLIDENNLNVIGYPKVNPIAENQFEVVFEVMPEFELQDVSNLEIEKLESEVSESDIDNMVSELQKQQANWIEVTNPAQLNDRLTISYEGVIDGKPFEGGSKENHVMILGSKSMLPEFEEALFDKKAGESISFDLKFPTDYVAQNLRDKEAHFSVTIHSVSSPELPEVNTDFIKKFGISSGNIDELKEELKKNMVRELNNKLQSQLKKEVMDQLIAANPVTLPETMILNEIGILAEQSKLPKPNNPKEQEDYFRIVNQLFRPEAQRRAHLNLVLSNYIETNKIKLDNQYLESRLDSIASTYENPQEVKEYFKNDKKMLASIRNLALEDQLVDSLVNKMKVSSKKVSFDSVMKPGYSQ